MRRDQINKSYTEIDFYNSYLDRIDLNSNYNISETLFRSILKDYFTMVSDDIIVKSREFRVPFNLGYIYVLKSKPNPSTTSRFRVDFVSTRELGKVIYHLNEHSDGYNYTFHWDRTKVIGYLPFLYEFKMNRTNKRLLASAIKSRVTDYRQK